MKVLVYEHLSAGAADGADAAELLPQGLAMRDAMVADLRTQVNCAVSVAGADPAHATQVLHAAPGESAPDFVARQAAQHDLVWLVAPESGGLLHRFACVVERTRWLGCTPAAIELAGSKRATLERLHACGVETPLRFDGDPSDPAHCWVVKPDDGAGAVDTRRYASFDAARAELRARQRAGVTACLEPWVDGEHLSLSLACADDGACELLSVNRQRIGIRGDGAVSFDGVELDAIGRGDARYGELAALAARVALAIPGLHGFVGIDLVWHTRRGAVVIEVNPRLTSAYVGLSARLRRPLAAELIAAHRRSLNA